MKKKTQKKPKVKIDKKKHAEEQYRLAHMTKDGGMTCGSRGRSEPA